jgi:hypothetical protein
MRLRGAVALMLTLSLPVLAEGQASAILSQDVSDLAGCVGPDDPDCAVPPASPKPPIIGGGGPGQVEAPKVIAWTSAYDINPFNGSKGGIFISRLDGSGQRRLTEFSNGNKEFTPHGLNAPDDHPSFSHDGKRIVFASNRANSNNWDIYVMNVNGTGVQRLTTSSALDTEPVFSPDDRYIVFSSARTGNTALWSMRADGSNQQLVFDSSAADLEPAWRPDGQQVVFTQSIGAGNKDLFTLDLAEIPRESHSATSPDFLTGALRRLTFTTGEDHDGTYSPEGTEIVYTSEREPFDPPYGNTYKLRVSDLANLGDLTTDLRLGAGDPFWSFDGRRIAFFHSSTRFVRSPQQLWVMAKNGAGKVHLPGGSGVANIHPAIGPTADSDGDGTLDYLESGSVGRPSLHARRRVEAGKRFQVRLGWRHPKAWKAMRSELLVLTLGRTPVGLIRFDIGTGLFFLWDSANGGYGAHGRAGQKRRLRAGALTLDLTRTEVVPIDEQRIRLDLAVKLGREAAGHTLGLEARADDTLGRSQQDAHPRRRIRFTR